MKEGSNDISTLPITEREIASVMWVADAQVVEVTSYVLTNPFVKIFDHIMSAWTQ